MTSSASQLACLQVCELAPGICQHRMLMDYTLREIQIQLSGEFNCADRAETDTIVFSVIENRHLAFPRKKKRLRFR